MDTLTREELRELAKEGMNERLTAKLQEFAKQLGREQAQAKLASGDL